MLLLVDQLHNFTVAGVQPGSSKQTSEEGQILFLHSLLQGVTDISEGSA